jgi:hypothetical protein
MNVPLSPGCWTSGMIGGFSCRFFTLFQLMPANHGWFFTSSAPPLHNFCSIYIYIHTHTHTPNIIFTTKTIWKVSDKQKTLVWYVLSTHLMYLIYVCVFIQRNYRRFPSRWDLSTLSKPLRRSIVVVSIVDGKSILPLNILSYIPNGELSVNGGYLDPIYEPWVVLIGFLQREVISYRLDVPDEHLINENTERPPINCFVVAFCLNHFGSCRTYHFKNE